MRRLLSGCRHAHAESAVGSASMRWLRRADLGSEEIAYRIAQNLYSLHRSVRVTDPPKWVRQTFPPSCPGQCPLCPQKRTLSGGSGMSAKCQKRTSGMACGTLRFTPRRTSYDRKRKANSRHSHSQRDDQSRLGRPHVVLVAEPRRAHCA